MVMAQLFGAGFAKDAFEVAFRIPNLLRDFFAENALSASFVPVFVDKMQHTDKREIWRFANNLFNTLFIVVGVLVALGVVFSPQIVSVIGHGFQKVPGKMELTTLLNRILFPFLLFISLSAWSTGVLNAHHSFFLPAVSSAFFNIISIAGAYLTYNYWISQGLDPVIGMAVGGIAGVFIQFLVTYIAVWPKGYRYRPYVNWRSPDLWRVLKLWGPVVIGLAIVEINVAVDTFLAAFLEQGSVSWLSYAYRIMHLPMGLFGAAIGTVSLPLFARQLSTGDMEGLNHSLQRSLRTVSVLLIPTLLFFVAFAEPIIRVIYEHGAFTVKDTVNTSHALMLYVSGIWAAASVRTLAGAFYAFKDARTPMFVNLGSAALNVVMNVSLMGILKFRALAMDTAIASFVSMILLMILLKRKFPAWQSADHVLYGLKVALAALLSVAPLWLCYRFLLMPLIKGFWPTLALLSGAVVLFLLLYFLIAKLLKINELSRILKRK